MAVRDGSTARQVSPEMFQGVMRLLADHPELTPDGVRDLVDARGRRRPRAEAIRPRSTAEVVQLVDAKVITRAEARAYLRLK